MPSEWPRGVIQPGWSLSSLHLFGLGPFPGLGLPCHICWTQDGFLFDPNKLLLNPQYSASATFAVTPRNSSLWYGPRILAKREAYKEADPTDPGSNSSLSNNPELALTWLRGLCLFPSRVHSRPQEDGGDGTRRPVVPGRWRCGGSCQALVDRALPHHSPLSEFLCPVSPLSRLPSHRSPFLALASCTLWKR